MSLSRPVSVAVACGGTGGHLFPGMAVGRALMMRGALVTLLVSPKEVDQAAVRDVTGMRVETLPAVGLQGRNHAKFGWGFLRSFWLSRRLFRRETPVMVLAMGGFTGAPPVLAGRWAGAATALHESNTVPGRANRMLARWVGNSFVGFAEAGPRLGGARVVVTGTPVREIFRPMEAAAARIELGLDPGRPVLVILGGSQGATGLNEAVRAALPAMARHWPTLQYIHLTGARDVSAMTLAYAGLGLDARVSAFSDRMDLVLGAATTALARSGASTLAELAAMGVPSVLVPFPAATDDHQRVNAEAFVKAGAARMLAQRDAQPRLLCDALSGLVDSAVERERMGAAAVRLHRADAAERIAEHLLAAASGPFASRPWESGVPAQPRPEWIR